MWITHPDLLQLFHLQLSLVIIAVLLCPHALINGQAPLATSPAPSPTPVPAPAPAPPAFCNITQVIQSAGQFSNFLQLLSDTQAGQKFQGQANRSDVGITVFAPTDEAFAALPTATLLKTITEQQKVSLCEFHALTAWYPLSSLQQVNNMMLSTFATYNDNTNGGKYAVNVSDVNGTVTLQTEWTNAGIISTLYNAEPCSIFAINQVLLSVDIFGMPLTAPAPAPSPGSTSASGPESTSKSSPQPSDAARPASIHSCFQAVVLISVLVLSLQLFMV